MTPSLGIGGGAPEFQQSVLHAGCGPARKPQMPAAFNTIAWREIRYDINPDAQPDIVGTITDMSPVATESVDAVYTSHVIEHLYPHEVPVALKEFHRVLKPGGFTVLTCPDIQSVAEFVARGQLLEPLYMSGMGPISPIDILYGHRGAMAQGNLFMAHRTAFTAQSLLQSLVEAGFARVSVLRVEGYALWAVGTRDPVDDEELEWFTSTFLPPRRPPGP